MNLINKPFPALDLAELYAILRLRQEVFIVEQHCFYLDADGKDQESLHLTAWDDAGALRACARVLPVGLSYEDAASIGRVAVAKAARGTGLGAQIMREALIFIRKKWGAVPVKIGAQVYAIPFYEKLDFAVISSEYDDAGVPHVTMLAAA